jgi:hypothetical protein
MLEKPRPLDVDPTVEDRLISEPRLQTEAIRNDTTYREGEFVITQKHGTVQRSEKYLQIG